MFMQGCCCGDVTLFGQASDSIERVVEYDPTAAIQGSDTEEQKICFLIFKVSRTQGCQTQKHPNPEHCLLAGADGGIVGDSISLHALRAHLLHTRELNR